jgi:hypothetical protein
MTRVIAARITNAFNGVFEWGKGELKWRAELELGTTQIIAGLMKLAHCDYFPATVSLLEK